MVRTQGSRTFEPLGWRTLRNRHTGETLHLRRIVRDGVRCLELRGTLPPGHDGPPLHIHYHEDEEGTVITGTLAAVVDGRQLRARVGETAPLPMGSAHRWWNGGDDMLEFEGVARPVVDLDVYLAAAFDVLNSGQANRPPLFYMAHLAWRHRKTQAVLFAPRWVQAIVLPVIVCVGTILGRYRGTAWPGCPARFAPAPAADAHRDVNEPRTSPSFA